ncbi:MAG: T9SS type A sorting domain-containing protein [Cyclobacteriaceae bacterium]|nr:T9SS type A sorting domain-containing protein [Cyclobacteriaceae bacterium]
MVGASTFEAYSQVTLVSWSFADGNATADEWIPVNSTKIISREPGTPSITYSYPSFAQSNQWKDGATTKYWQIEVNTEGFQNILLSSKQSSSSPGPRDFIIEYKIGTGGTWTSFTNNNIPPLGDDWTSGVVSNLPLPSEVDNQPSVFIRWVMSSNIRIIGGSVIASGTSSIDDIVISGNSTSNSQVNISTLNNPPSGTIEAETTNNLLYGLALDVTVADANLSSMTLKTNGTYNTGDIEQNGINLWYSTDAVFDSNSDLVIKTIDRVASGSDLVFTGLNQTINSGNSGYLFITIDLSSSAIGRTIFIDAPPLSNLIFNPPAIKTGTTSPGNVQTFYCIDNDTDVYESEQPPAAEILSTSNDAESAVDVMTIYFFDLGTCDALNTIVTNIRLKPYSTNTADWTDHIGGAVVKINGGAIIESDAAIITDEYIDIPITAGNLVIPSIDELVIDVSVFLRSANTLADGSVLSFRVDYLDHGFTADPSGSGFFPELVLGYDMNSNDFTVQVNTSHLQFENQPVSTGLGTAMPETVTVVGTDVHGNFDVEFAEQVSLTSSGVLVGTPILMNAVAGVASFPNIRHNAIGDGLVLTASGTEKTSAISNPFDITSLNQTFTTCPIPNWVSIIIQGKGWVCGSGYSSVNGLGASGPSEAWNISPLISFDMLSNEVLTFDSYTSGTDDIHPKLEVLYSTNYSGSGNPYLADWESLSFSPSSEDASIWTPSGAIDLSAIPANGRIAFKYTSSGNTPGSATEWRIDNVLISQQGCESPTIQASNISFSDIQSEQMTLAWVNGNGTGRMVIAKEGAPVEALPVNETNYTLGDDLGNGNVVVYKGNGTSATVTNLQPDHTYHFAVFEYNCDADNPTFNTNSPAIGSQRTNASDIIANPDFVYPVDIEYQSYAALASSMRTSNSLEVFGMKLRDGGATAATDLKNTIITSISFSTNGSRALKAAAINNGTKLVSPMNINGDTEFTIPIAVDSLVALDGEITDFYLVVTFGQGDYIVDNEQLVFTITGVTYETTGTPLINSTGGGAESITTGGNENTIRVEATKLNFVQISTHTLQVDSPFSIEVEAIDDKNTRDVDQTLNISVEDGTGDLSPIVDLTQTTSSGTALWPSLTYNIEESNIIFKIKNLTQNLSLLTNQLNVKAGLSIFTFTGSVGDEPSFPPDNEPIGLDLSNITRGASLQTEQLAGAFNARDWSLASNSVEDDYYYEFSIAANEGYSFNLNSIELDHRRSDSGPVLWEVRTSLDAFATAIDQVYSTNVPFTWYLNEEIDFNSLAQNQSSLTVRIYAYNAEGGLGTWAIDNLSIFGVINDVAPPSFTASPAFPQYDSVAVDGFDLLLNLDEPATLYLVVQDPSIAQPDATQVISGINGGGVAAEASDTINITQQDSTFWARVRGLSAVSSYNIYYVLDDGTNQSDVIEQTGVPLSDIDTDFAAALTQPGTTTISSLADSAQEAVPVFGFNIVDTGTNDGAPTHVTRLVFDVGAGNTVIDWTTAIAGVTLYNNTESMAIPVVDTISATSITVDIALGDLTIADATSEEIILSVWLTGNVTDNEVLAFSLGGTDHGNVNNAIGSQLAGTLTDLVSNEVSIDVVGERLHFTSVPATVASGVEFSLSVQAIDANGNLDLDNNQTIDLSRGLGTGTITSTSSTPAAPQMMLAAGEANWTDLLYDATNEFFTIIATDNAALLLSDTTTVIEVGEAIDLIVTTGNVVTISTDQSYNNVEVEPGASLRLNEGIVLGVAGNLTLDGTFTDLGATTHFNGTGEQTILSSVPNRTDTFRNITVSNTNAVGVVSNIHIRLINTLKINGNATIDVDGADDTRNFTLVSTPGNTARIATIEDGGKLEGQIVWQRSLRTGPEGWRYIGTPIKGQKLSNISDDIWIQGVAERYPTGWTNIGTYNENLGTTGARGVDGWENFTSMTNDVDVATGMKLWLWTKEYATEQVIINKGLPVIGDGIDNVAGNPETYNFDISFLSSSLDGGGWNFFANPYPCEIDWDLVTKSDISGSAVYIWNPTNQQYGTYSAGLGINGVSQYIASGQGFFVKANVATANLSVSESSKASANGNSFLRKSDEPLAKVFIKVKSEQGKEDETAVAFVSHATNEYDVSYDALKFAGGYVNLSSKINDKLLAINAMGEARGVQVVKLNIDPYQFGNYTMTFPKIEDMPEGTMMRLKDKYVNKTTTVSNSATYQFSITKNIAQSYGADRFELQLVSPATFRFDELSIRSGQEFVMPVLVDQLADVIGTSLSLNWDPSALEFVGIEESDVAGMDAFYLQQVSQGKLVFDQTSENPIDLPNGSKLFALRFKAKSGQPNASLRFERSSIFIKAIGGMDMPFNTKDVTINILQNKFIAGRVETYSGLPINGVEVKATASEESLARLTSTDGAYALETYEQSSYMLSASKQDDTPLQKYVTTLDIIKTRRHMLQMEEFGDPYQYIAADVDGSKSISAIDLVEMRKVILGISQSFRSGYNWLFIPASFDLSTDPFSYATSIEVPLDEEDINLNFKGVKAGDVNNSWINDASGRTSKESIALDLEDIRMEGERIEIPVVAGNFKDISGFQFTIGWDASQLEYVGISQSVFELSLNEEMARQGVVATMWDEHHGKAASLDDGTIVFVMEFVVLEPEAISTVELNSAITEAMAYDDRLNQLSIRSNAANIDINALRNGKLELFQNFPNPFSTDTKVKFKIAKKGLTQFTVVNMLGEIIYADERVYDAGIHEIDWSRNKANRAIAPGIYLYRLYSNGEEAVKKMLIE